MEAFKNLHSLMFKVAGEFQEAILSTAANKTKNLHIPIICWEAKLYLLNSAFLHDEK